MDNWISTVPSSRHSAFHDAHVASQQNFAQLKSVFFDGVDNLNNRHKADAIEAFVELLMVRQPLPPSHLPPLSHSLLSCPVMLLLPQVRFFCRWPLRQPHKVRFVCIT
jgi:hypothetical protein